jgi:hypothetical protein
MTARPLFPPLPRQIADRMEAGKNNRVASALPRFLRLESLP